MSRPTGQETSAYDADDMENVGRALMETIAQNLPGYSYNECPSEVVVDLINERDDARRELAAKTDAPTPMLLWCPECGERHIDVGDFATKVHHTHACQSCGMVWRPAVGPTVGVQWLPGFKNRGDM